MIIYRAFFPSEIDEEIGETSWYFPTLASVFSKCKEFLQSSVKRRQERGTQHKGSLTAEVFVVTLPSVTRESFCDIINSRGRNFVAEERKIYDLVRNEAGKFQILPVKEVLHDSGE